MRELWRRIIEWLRRLRLNPGYSHARPDHWDHLEWFPTDGITGPPGTRTDVVPEPEPYRATVLRDRRSEASR